MHLEQLMRVRASLLLLAVVVVCACATVRGERHRAGVLGQPLSLTAPDLEGHDVDIGARSGRVRVVDFWATWCEPCKEAMPVLDAMARELAPRGLEVYGVSIDEDVPQIAAYLRERPVTFPILWDQGAVRLTRLGVTFMPVTLVVDRRGIVRYVHQGWDPAQAQHERDEVEALLGEP